MWLLQNLVSGWVQAALAIGFGLAVAYFKQHGNALVDPLLYGVGASVLLLMAFAAIRVSIHHRVDQRVTPKNVESKARQWLDNFGARVKRLGNPDHHFSYEIHTPFGNASMVLFRAVKKPNYLGLATSISPWPQLTAALERAPAGDVERLVSTIRIELNGSQLTGYQGVMLPLSMIVMNLETPIVPTLSEHDFVKAITHLEGVLATVAERFRIFITEHPERSDGASNKGISVIS